MTWTAVRRTRMFPRVGTQPHIVPQGRHAATHARADLHSHGRRTHAHTCTHAHARITTHAHSLTHTPVHTRKRARTHPRARAHTHHRKHAHARARSQRSSTSTTRRSTLPSTRRCAICVCVSAQSVRSAAARMASPRACFARRLPPGRTSGAALRAGLARSQRVAARSGALRGSCRGTT